MFFRAFSHAFVRWSTVGTVSVATVSLFYDRHRVSAAISASNPQTIWDDNWDGRKPEGLLRPDLNASHDPDETRRLDKVTSKATRHILLIRHGQYHTHGKSDSEHVLTDTGKEQAQFTAKRLADLGLNYTTVINSTMSRAVETTDVLLSHGNGALVKVKHEIDPLLREGAPCQPDPPVASWKPAAKQFLEDGSRIEAAFRKYFHRAEPEQHSDSVEVVVCHANVIRYFVCRALQLPPEAWLRMSLAHCSVTYLIIRPSGRVVLRSLGDTGHLPPKLVTYL